MAKKKKYTKEQELDIKYNRSRSRCHKCFEMYFRYWLNPVRDDICAKCRNNKGE